MKIWESNFILKYSNQPLKHQPVFIIGAPRTGSTILYQTLTNQLDVLYVDNLICQFYRNFFFGFWLSNKIFKQNPHNYFNSNHGNTESGGYHAPSECGNLWYKWLLSDKHFIDHDDITNVMVEEIRKEITAVINYFDQPLVFKNLNAGQRLRLLSRCFPNAKIIFIKRSPIFTAQSILKAKRKVGVADNIFWSIKPSNFEVLKSLNSYEQIIKQIYYIEKQILEDRKLFSSEQFLTIDYNVLCNNLEATLELCQIFIGTKKKSRFEKAVLRIAEKLQLNNSEIIKFKEEIRKLDWVNYSD